MAVRTRVPVLEIPGAGRLYDWRGTSMLPPSGPKIKLLAMVEHIPVIRNEVGIGDFVTLANVLRAQRLSLQAATDREGNVALYNDLACLCFQARGLNGASAGVEHMHATTAEAWTKRQLRASAWLWVRAKKVHDIPYERGKLANGGTGIARVVRKGHVSHEQVSNAAGYFDRSDPGEGYDWEYVRHCARFWERKGTFEGA